MVSWLLSVSPIYSSFSAACLIFPVLRLIEISPVFQNNTATTLWLNKALTSISTGVPLSLQLGCYSRKHGMQSDWPYTFILCTSTLICGKLFTITLRKGEGNSKCQTTSNQIAQIQDVGALLCDDCAVANDRTISSVPRSLAFSIYI